MIKLPKNVLIAISMLENSGYEAFAVGGAVRDSLLGKEASDFDITTSAFPNETKKVFHEYKTIETGIKHGTVTVLFDDEPLEITTYRVDGEYADNRHPQSVTFTRNINEDLSRRDFTINAIGYNPKKGIVDPYNGVNDLKNKVIRSVGDSKKRFSEDALRILRCIRFSSVLGFDIEPDTAKNVVKMAHLLDNISAERIFSELKKLICGKNAAVILKEFPQVITKIVPELSKSVGFDQKSKYHIYDVYTHTYKSLEASDDNLYVRLALLYHDCGKPYVYTTDENGYRHFHGHQPKSAQLAKESLLRLKCDSKTIERIETLVLYHDYKLECNKKSVKKFLAKVSFEDARLIIKIKYADMAAHAPLYAMSEETKEKFLSIIDEIEKDGECVSLKTLAIRGDDLLNIGMCSGVAVGQALQFLLEEVVSETIPNEKNALINRAKALMNDGMIG